MKEINNTIKTIAEGVKNASHGLGLLDFKKLQFPFFWIVPFQQRCDDPHVKNETNKNVRMFIAYQC